MVAVFICDYWKLNKEGVIKCDNFYLLFSHPYRNNFIFDSNRFFIFDFRKLSVRVMNRFTERQNPE